MRRRLNGSPDEEYIDMFLGFDPSRNAANPYYVMDYFGEMWDKDVTRDQIRDFAITALNKLTRCGPDLGGLTQDELSALEDADRFMDDLNNVDFANPTHMAYFTAVALSGTTPGAENEAVGGIFKDNGDGCINPPILGDRGFTIKVSGKDTVIGFKEENGTLSRIDVAGIALEKIPPLGFGSPSGLRTLAKMHRRGINRGYDNAFLKQAAMHYDTLVKVHTVWKCVFPNHDLGTEAACPFYFRSRNREENETTAFGLNLYSHARYPVFAKDLGKIGAGGANKTHGSVEKALIAAGNKLGLNVGERAAELYSQTESPTVKASLAEAGTVTRVERNYRNKPYKTEKSVLDAWEFVASMLAQEPEAKGIKMATLVLEILLNDSYPGNLDWKAELQRSLDKPRVGGVEPVLPKKVQGAHYNTRLCVNPEEFHRLAGRAENLPVLPMNVFVPTQPLGGGAEDDFKYAAGAVRRNTVSSLTTAPLMAGHVKGIHSNNLGKRDSLPENSFMPAGTRGRRSHSMFSGLDEESQREALYGGIPAAPSAYGSAFSDLDASMHSASETVPANIALDLVYRVFTLDGDHSDITGDGRTLHYRRSMVEKFHQWAHEKKACIR